MLPPFGGASCVPLTWLGPISIGLMGLDQPYTESMKCVSVSPLCHETIPPTAMARKSVLKSSFPLGIAFVAEEGKPLIKPCTQTIPSIDKVKIGPPFLAETPTSGLFNIACLV